MVGKYTWYFVPGKYDSKEGDIELIIKIESSEYIFWVLQVLDEFRISLNYSKQSCRGKISEEKNISCQILLIILSSYLLHVFYAYNNFRIIRGLK